MQKKLVNISGEEQPILIATNDRAKGLKYDRLVPGQEMTLDESEVTDQIKVLASPKRKGRGPLITMEDVVEIQEEVVEELELEDVEESSLTEEDEDTKDDEEDNFVCDICDREFNTQRGLKIHLRSHE